MPPSLSKRNLKVIIFRDIRAPTPILAIESFCGVTDGCNVKIRIQLINPAKAANANPIRAHLIRKGADVYLSLTALYPQEV